MEQDERLVSEFFAVVSDDAAPLPPSQLIWWCVALFWPSLAGFSCWYSRARFVLPYSRSAADLLPVCRRVDSDRGGLVFVSGGSP
jgi:hypothetical protein